MTAAPPRVPLLASTGLVPNVEAGLVRGQSPHKTQSDSAENIAQQACRQQADLSDGHKLYDDTAARSIGRNHDVEL